MLVGEVKRLPLCERIRVCGCASACKSRVLALLLLVTPDAKEGEGLDEGFAVGETFEAAAAAATEGARRVGVRTGSLPLLRALDERAQAEDEAPERLDDATEGGCADAVDVFPAS